MGETIYKRSSAWNLLLIVLLMRLFSVEGMSLQQKGFFI